MKNKKHSDIAWSLNRARANYKLYYNEICNIKQKIIFARQDYHERIFLNAYRGRLKDCQHFISEIELEIKFLKKEIYKYQYIYSKKLKYHEK